MLVEVLLLDLRLQPEGIEHALPLLDPAERARAEALRAAVDAGARRRYIVAHALLRQQLAARLGCAAGALRLGHGAHGKPVLADGGSLHFNLSHSGDVVALALAPRPVGVDIEQRRPLADLLALARSSLAPGEQALVAGSADPEATFFSLWTAKEAVLKASGLGLQREPASFELALPQSAPQRTGAAAGDAVLATLAVAALPAPPGHVGAVATAGTDWRVEVRALHLQAWTET